MLETCTLAVLVLMNSADADLAIGSAIRHQLQHLEFARRQPSDRTRLRRRRHNETGALRQRRNPIGQQSRAEGDRLLRRGRQHFLGLGTLPPRDQVLAQPQARIRTQMGGRRLLPPADPMRTATLLPCHPARR